MEGNESDHLPEEFESVGIKDMIEGEEAYTVPWAIWVDREGKLRINGEYDFHSEPHGTASMRIKKRGNEILVDVNSIKGERFSRSVGPPHLGSTSEKYLPVKFVKNKFEDS
jgi:hypothetical protein